MEKSDGRMLDGMYVPNVLCTEIIMSCPAKGNKYSISTVISESPSIYDGGRGSGVCGRGAFRTGYHSVRRLGYKTRLDIYYPYSFFRLLFSQSSLPPSLPSTSTPAHSSPLQSSPINQTQSSPVPSSPFRPSPFQLSPFQSSPIQSSPIH